MRRVRVGLMRHFEVKKPFPAGWLTAQDLAVWLDEYNRAEVISRPLDLGGISWAKCFSSDMSRAYVTAQAAFSGVIQSLPELREAEIHPFGAGNLRLPLLGWQWLHRLAWLTSHPSQRPAKETTLTRVRFIANEILARVEEDTLIVSHAGTMSFLRKELVAMGFVGPKFNLAENGRLYVFERQ